MIGVKRTLLSAFVGLLLVATAVASVWLMASAGVFTGDEAPLPGAPVAEETATSLQAAAPDGAPVGHVGQPRDPFEPIITTTSTTEGATTTTNGATTTTGAGTTTTAGGTTTSTTQDDSPDTRRVTLLEVREEDGVRIAVVEVDDETFTVGVGDTFADGFKVIDLTEDGGVFTYNGNAFTLSVGQTTQK